MEGLGRRIASATGYLLNFIGRIFQELRLTEVKHCTSSIFLTLRDSGINISFY